MRLSALTPSTDYGRDTKEVQPRACARPGALPRRRGLPPCGTAGDPRQPGGMALPTTYGTTSWQASAFSRSPRRNDYAWSWRRRLSMETPRLTPLARTPASGWSLPTAGEQSRDFTYVDDAVAATLASMDGGPAGIVYKVIKEGAARGDIGRMGADTTLIRSELGWTPRTSLPEGPAAQLAAASP
jgi:nucleoside-diphosphate-sugar epimerase